MSNTEGESESLEQLRSEKEVLRQAMSELYEAIISNYSVIDPALYSRAQAFKPLADAYGRDSRFEVPVSREEAPPNGAKPPAGGA